MRVRLAPMGADRARTAREDAGGGRCGFAAEVASIRGVVGGAAWDVGGPRDVRGAWMVRGTVVEIVAVRRRVDWAGGERW